MNTYTQIVAVIFIIIVGFKIYYVHQIAKKRKSLSSMLGYFVLNTLFWALPILRRAIDDQERILIRKANITTLIFWILFFIVVFSSLLFV